MAHYLMRVLLALDRFGNALCGGSDLETISSRVGRNFGKNTLADALVGILGDLDPDHVVDVAINNGMSREDAEKLKVLIDEWRARRKPVGPGNVEAP